MNRHIVVMGVSGCGKSTVGDLLARKLGAVYLDGDSLHSESNVAKMHAGTPLNDLDREPWLREISRRFGAAGETGLVIACSALKRSYRDIIRSQDPSVQFVHLHGTRELLAARMNSRPEHFMPTALLDSQLATLEQLEDDEAGRVFDIAESPSQIAAAAARWLTGDE